VNIDTEDLKRKLGEPGAPGSLTVDRPVLDALIAGIDKLQAEHEGWQRDCLSAVKREQALRKMIAKARAAMRCGYDNDAYAALDTRRAGR
jgi:hypothetical protein